MENYAVVINLNGNMLSSAIKSWDTLLSVFNIKHISSTSFAPHITLIAGSCSSKETEIINSLQKIVIDFAPFETVGNGLDVFILETPLIYSRWLLSEEMHRLYLALKSHLGWDIMQSYCPEVWQPKTTIAFHDTDYSCLPHALAKLRENNFKQPMIVKELSLLTFSKKRESLIKTITI